MMRKLDCTERVAKLLPNPAAIAALSSLSDNSGIASQHAASEQIILGLSSDFVSFLEDWADTPDAALCGANALANIASHTPHVKDLLKCDALVAAMLPLISLLRVHGSMIRACEDADVAKTKDKSAPAVPTSPLVLACLELILALIRGDDPNAKTEFLANNGSAILVACLSAIDGTVCCHLESEDEDVVFSHPDWAVVVTTCSLLLCLTVEAEPVAASEVTNELLEVRV
jgi:hypothetical protein